MADPLNWIKSLLAVVENLRGLWKASLLLAGFVFLSASALFTIKEIGIGFVHLNDLKPEYQAILGTAWVVSLVVIIMCLAAPLTWLACRKISGWYNSPIRVFRRMQPEEQCICLSYFLAGGREQYLICDNFHVLSLVERGVLRKQTDHGQSAIYKIDERFWRALGPIAPMLLESFDPKSGMMRSTIQMIDKANAVATTWMSR